MFMLLFILPTITAILILYYLCTICSYVLNDIKKLCTHEYSIVVNKALVYAVDPYDGKISCEDVTKIFINKTSGLSWLLRKPLFSTDLNNRTTQYYYLFVNFEHVPSKTEYICYYDINYSHRKIIFPPQSVDCFENTVDRQVHAKLVLASELNSVRCCTTYSTVSNILLPLLGPCNNFFKNSHCGQQISDPVIVYIQLYDYIKHLLKSQNHIPEHLNLKINIPSTAKHYNVDLNDILLWYTPHTNDTK